MSKENDNAGREETGEQSDGPDNGMRNDFTGEALAALAALDAHGNDHIDLALRFGEAVSKAKAHLQHGQFNPWCQDVLKRTPSWVSARRRLYESQHDLKPALAWATEKKHRWAKCHSPERLLKVIAEWKKAQAGDTPPPKARRKRSDLIAELKQRLNEAERELIALRDTLPPQVLAEIAKLAPLFSENDSTAKERLAELARNFHWRFQDLVAETCSAQQVSPPAPKQSVVVAMHYGRPAMTVKVEHLKSRSSR